MGARPPGRAGAHLLVQVSKNPKRLMQTTMDVETELFSPMEDRSVLGLKIPNVASENDGRTILVHVLEFKTSLLKAVEELHIHRDSEKRHEEQICKLVLEKQELEWQTESLRNKISRMSNENSESLAAVKKQFQAQIRKMEGEEGKIQLTAELKDKEITSLKEELKLLQLLRYSLENKLAELEQKLQLQTQLKDSHLNQLGEVERRFGAVSRQCAVVKQAHEKLEQNVEEAMRINTKLKSINVKQESTITALQKDVDRLNKQLVTLKVSSVCKPGDEHLQNVLKEQQLQEFQQRLLVETEFNKKLRNETATERAEKQEVFRSLHHTHCLLQTQTEALSRAEQELQTLQEEYQVLKAEHELNQERTREEQDSLARLRDKHQNSKLDWEKKMLQLQKTTEVDQVELKAVKEAYNQLQEENKRLSAVCLDHNTEDIPNSQNGSKRQESQSLESRTVGEINLIKLDVLHEDESLKEDLFSPHNDVEPTGRPLKSVPDESTADCQKDREDHDDSRFLKISLQVDRAITHVSTSAEPDISVSLMSDEISGLEEATAMTNQLSNLCAETDVCDGETDCNAVDKGCPSNQTRCDADSPTELSVPETSSVYEVDSDPLALEPKDGTLEQNLCISDVTEPQTSDKHTDSQRCATSQETKTVCTEIIDNQTAPEFLKSLSQTEDHTNTKRLPEDKTCNITHVSGDGIVGRPSQWQEATHQETVPFNDALLDLHESKDRFSPPEMISAQTQSCVSETVDSAETKLVEFQQLPSVAGALEPSAQSSLHSDSMEIISENTDQKDDCASASWTRTLEVQQSEVDVSSEAVFVHPNITNPNQDSSSADGFLKDVDHICMTAVGASNHAGYKRYRSSYGWDTFLKNKMNTQAKCADRNVDHSVGNRNSKPSLALTPSTSCKSEQRTSGFPEFVSPFCAPRFTKKAVMKTPDTPNKRPHQKSNFRGEWNAIKQSFSEMFTEKESQFLIPYSSTLSGVLASSSVGNGLRQDGTPTVFTPKLQNLETETRPVDEGVTAHSESKEEQSQSDIVAQIAKIDELMSSEGLTPHKIRKLD
ncbi:coiled-coil domain-containing protein 73-like isoform X3 [Triplophysa dalaica]|uniref:coiled-coil domain-containing protein 73-like isoform X3 n=1 Tax=Triplophysa dalaica TaxID=1582913 RepID=UPI0024DFEB9B|nr:coiled-coil domain-containing protein 73-like isoform X3 [Triplophysa dalaica]